MGKNDSNDRSIGSVVHVVRKDLSGIIGTATESLNRTLSEFREEGLIQIVKGGIKIVELEKLERLSH